MADVAADVLIVDDDDDVRVTLSHVLTAEGFSCATAAHGYEALQYLRQAPPPGLIVLDWMMPVCDGPTFRALQLGDGLLASIPVVFLSAGSGARAMATELQGAAYLEKPVSLERLFAVVARHCQRSHTSAT